MVSSISTSLWWNENEEEQRTIEEDCYPVVSFFIKFKEKMKQERIEKHTKNKEKKT